MPNPWITANLFTLGCVDADEADFDEDEIDPGNQFASQVLTVKESKVIPAEKIDPGTV